MGTTRRLIDRGQRGALVLLLGSSAQAALSSAQQKCIDGYNNKLRLVSQQAGKSARACIKNAGKGKEPNPDACILTNPDGKIAGKEAEGHRPLHRRQVHRRRADPAGRARRQRGAPRRGRGPGARSLRRPGERRDQPRARPTRSARTRRFSAPPRSSPRR